MSLLWPDLLVLPIGIAFTKTDAKERPFTRLTMSALPAHWLGLLLSISDVRAQIVHSLLILQVTCHRAVPPAADMIGLLLNCRPLFF